MAITKEIKTIEDLRQRKQQLRLEIEASKQIVQQNLRSVAGKRSIKRVLLTMTATGLATYLFKQIQKGGEGQAEAFAAAFSSNGQPSWAGWLPVIRQVIDFALDFLERRYASGSPQPEKETPQV